MSKWFVLALGGVAGTYARYLLAGWVQGISSTGFPYGTLAVNGAGCFLVGVLAALAEEKFLLSPAARLLLMIGFCGAFTTFSTFILETSNLVRDGDTLRAFLNVMGSVALGFLLFRLGVWTLDLF